MNTLVDATLRMIRRAKIVDLRAGAAVERALKHCALWGALLAFWLGVTSEALMTCAVSIVCAPPRSFVADAVMILFFASMLRTSVRMVMNQR